MTSLPLPRRDRHLAALGVTVLVHALLILGWQAARQLPPRPAEVSWVALRPIVAPARIPAMPAKPAARPAPKLAPIRVRPAVPATDAALPSAPRDAAPLAPVEPAAAGEAAAETPSAPAAKAMVERALREAAGVDRALRKESRPLIVAPRDSPQIRLRKGIEAAAEMAPNKWYEAPKMAELVNNTGDGSRRTRVITGNGTYCVTEAPTNSRIDMIEKHGKWRTTSCPAHEAPSSAQEWRTARDP